MDLKYKTKQQRLVAVVDAYRRLVNRPVTMDEVSSWAMTCGLYPTPKRGDTVAACEAFEKALDEAVKAWPRGRDENLYQQATDAVAAMSRGAKAATE